MVNVSLEYSTTIIIITIFMVMIIAGSPVNKLLIEEPVS